MHDFGGVLRSTVSRVQRQGFIKGTVEKIVAEGFPAEDEVVELVLRALEGDPSDKELLEDIRKLTRQELRQHLYIQKSWTQKTDCDKIDDAFSALEGQRIFARQNVAVSEKSGRDQIRHLVKLEDGEHLGFVFFTAKDTENAVEFGELGLSFGAFDGDDAKSLETGQKVVAALTLVGLGVEWTGDLNDRILLPDVEWKKRRIDLDD